METSLKISQIVTALNLQ